MLKDPRNLLWIIPLAALVTLPLWKPFAADFLSPVRKETKPSPPSLTGPRALSISEMQDVQFEQSKNGAKEWLLTAIRLYSEGTDSDMQLEDVEALFFGPAGENEETHIKSLRAGYNASIEKITLQGDVVIQNNKGYEMRADSLEYLAAEKKMRTTSAVTIKGSNITVSGNRLLYDTLTGNYSIEGNVVCRIW
jgi:LPS export ABC transporter protein LptC